MTTSGRRRAVALTLALALPLAAAAGCGHALVRPTAATAATDGHAGDDAGSEAPAAPGPALERHALYDELERAEAMYGEGIEALVAGDELRGEALIVDAARAIEAAAEACARTEACETTRFVRAGERLLSRQGLELKLLALRVAELERSAALEPDVEPGVETELGGAEDEPASAAPVPAPLDPAATIFRGGDLRDAIRLNRPVRAALDDWLTWMRPQLAETFRRYAYLRPEMAPVYEASDMPEALLFGMLATESGGKVHAYSRAGAVGPLQFMRHTGRQYGLEQVGGRDERLDPARATRANADYLADRLDEFDGDLEKALAAYNGGESRMRRLHGRFRDAPFWDPRIYYEFPRETRDYVPRVLAAAWLFLHPEAFRLERPELDAAIVELTLDRELSLGELTICAGDDGAGGWFRELRNLNPWVTPRERLAAGSTLRVPRPVVDGYAAGCADDELVARARELHDANYPDRPEMIRYRVRRGDTLSRIASRHRCASLREIAAINRIRPPRYVVRAGQVLQIPGCE